ncbi:hypothetical protein [Pseudomonas sp. IT-P294]|uniref:hypothetical protein n=1 Tax=Pseudomonas sp. IT-P294 TaxID=3026454 RepID=UPI0039E0E937
MLEIAMAHNNRDVKRPNVSSKGGQALAANRRSYSAHAKQVNNAFLIIFDQYERAFEELAKV